MTDFHVTNHGSVFLIKPMNDAAQEHFDDHIGPDSQWFGGQLVVEHRYIIDLVAQLQDEGFEVS